MEQRNGKNCNMCGVVIYNWQSEEYDVLENLCPECSLEVSDYAESMDSDPEELAADLGYVF